MKKADYLTAEYLLSMLNKAPPTGRFLLAFSGGLDSNVLLHAVNAIRHRLEPADIVAVHVNHQIHVDAGSWARHCQQTCDALGIRLIQLRIDISDGSGPEASARVARYKAIEGIMRTGDVLLSAHHLDDQAETLLLNLMRGSGLRGLAGMPPLRPFGTGWLLRPLLDCSRQQLLAYAESHQLCWMDDPSNDDEQLDRNFLRHSVLPLIKQRWPSAAKSMALSACLLQQEELIVESVVDERLNSLLDNKQGMSLAALFESRPEMYHLLIKHWCRKRGFSVPPRQQVESFLVQLQSETGRLPSIEWDNLFMGRYAGRLLLHEQLPQLEESWQQQWNGEGKLQLPANLGYLTTQNASLPQVVTVHFRRGGERLLKNGMHRGLKGLFQQLGLPPWLRNRVPLLSISDELYAIADLLVCDHGEVGTIVWHRGSGYPDC